MGECLHALGEEGESKEWFSKAYQELSKDDWLKENGSERLARLKELGGG